MKLLVVSALCMPLGACVSLQPTNYGKLAAAVGDVVNAPKADAAVKKYADQFAAYCGEIRLGTLILSTVVHTKNQRVQEAIDIASSTINNLCAAPPSDLKSALVILADTVGTIQQARRQEGV